MNSKWTVIGLFAALLLLAACAPASPAVQTSEDEAAGRQDASVLVYASPL